MSSVTSQSAQGGDVALSRDSTCESAYQSAKSGWWLVLALAVSTVFLYLSLFGLSGIPYFRTGDEDFFWTYGWRMLAGQVFLRDFHQFTPPGSDLLYAAAFHLFGVSMSTISWLIVALGLAYALCVFRIARFFLRPSLAALSTLCAIVIMYGDRLDATHHWFSSLANLAAVLILLPRRTYLRIAAAGALFAVAAFFTQTRGAVGLIACCAAFLWEWRRGGITSRILSRRIALVVGVTFFVWLALSWRFIAQAGLATYWHAQVVYLPKDATYPYGFLIPPFNLQSHPSAIVLFVNRVAMYLLLLVACPWGLYQCIRGRCEDSRDPVALFLLASLGVMQAIEVITVLNWNRMAAVEIPAAILIVYLVSQKQQRYHWLVPACWVFLAAIGVGKCVPTIMHHYARIQLPGGAVLAQREDAEEVSWMATHTRPGDTFLEAGNTRLYALFELRNPTPVDMLTGAPNTLPVWVSEEVQGLRNTPTHYIMWAGPPDLDMVEQLHTKDSDYLDPLRIYMQRNYIRVQTLANGEEIWERREWPSAQH